MIPRLHYSTHHDPVVRDLLAAVRALTPQDSATIKWQGTDTGVKANILAPPPTYTLPQPYQIIGIYGVRASVTGSFSATTPFLWFNIENNTAEWKATDTEGAAWPPDTLIRDGRLGGPVEWWPER